MTTEMPPNTEIKVTSGPYISENRNRGVKDTSGDFIWFLDDDHVWSPNTLQTLLDKDKDIIGPLILSRKPPFEPVAKIATEKEHLPIDYMNIKEDTTEVHYIGGAGILVKREVFENIPYPWFYADLIGNTFIGEDVYFCRKAQDHGYKITLDLTTTMGHTNIFHVEPKRVNGEWKTEIDFGENKVIYLERNI